MVVLFVYLLALLYCALFVFPCCTSYIFVRLYVLIHICLYLLLTVALVNVCAFYSCAFVLDACLYLCFSLYLYLCVCVYRCTLWPLWTLDMIRGPAGVSEQGAAAQRS